MKYEAVKGRAILAEGAETSLQGETGTGRDRYDLATAIRVVREMETSPGRAAVFNEVKNKNTLYRIVDTLYTLAGKRFLQPVILWVYMLKCVLTVGWFRSDGSNVVSIANFPNEERTVDRVARLMPDEKIMRLSIWRKHLFGQGQLGATFRMIGAFARLWPFLRLLARAHSFMPAARIASALAFYMRFLPMFTERPELRAAIIPSNYSPEAVGLAAAAHRTGRRVIYANHAPVPINAEVVPPVYADIALLYGDETTRTYAARTECSAEIVLIGQPGRSRAMEWTDRVNKVGIFLTSGTKRDVLAKLITDIRQTNPDVAILVRDHPVALLKNDLSALTGSDPKVVCTIGNDLDEEILACDLVICGNSTVTLDVLSGGRPVAFLDELDTVKSDANGFTASGLVLPITGWSENLYARLKTFYNDPAWRQIMRGYDASYEADTDALNRRAAARIASYVHFDEKGEMMTEGERKPSSEDLQRLGREAYAEGRNVTQTLRDHLGTTQNTPDVIEVAYDMQAGSYVKFAEDELDFMKEYAAQLASHLDPHLEEGDSLLDAGTGEMTTLTHLVLALGTKPDQVHACDISQKRVDIGRQYAKDHGLDIPGIRAELGDLPFDDDSIDVITTNHAVEPNGGRERDILAELLRVAKRKLVLFEPCYEIADEEGKKRMEHHGYIRGLADHAEALGATVESVTPMKQVHNPLNPTACYVIRPSAG